MLVGLMGVLDMIAAGGLFFLGVEGFLFWVAVLLFIKGLYSLGCMFKGGG